MDMPETSSNARKRTPEALAFAAQLRAERAAANMSQDDLAKATGISKPTIARIELGQRTMDTAQLGAICRALGLSLTTFAVRAEGRLIAEQAGEAPPSAAGRG
jgi:transcriptional regulator with XRE-family HTH domain